MQCYALGDDVMMCARARVCVCVCVQDGTDPAGRLEANAPRIGLSALQTLIVLFRCGKTWAVICCQKYCWVDDEFRPRTFIHAAIVGLSSKQRSGSSSPPRKRYLSEKIAAISLRNERRKSYLRKQRVAAKRQHSRKCDIISMFRINDRVACMEEQCKSTRMACLRNTN